MLMDEQMKDIVNTIAHPEHSSGELKKSDTAAYGTHTEFMKGFFLAQDRRVCR